MHMVLYDSVCCYSRWNEVMIGSCTWI